MASRYTLKAGDTGPPLNATLEDKNGPVNLTEASTITMLMLVEGAETAGVAAPPLLSKTASIVAAAKGEIRVAWGATDTAIPGTYNLEFRVKWNNGEVESFPNEGYVQMTIKEQL